MRPTAPSRRRKEASRSARAGGPAAAQASRAHSGSSAVWHPDVAALRRYLVDEGLLTREVGVYWRIGGYVEV